MHRKCILPENAKGRNKKQTVTLLTQILLILTHNTIGFFAEMCGFFQQYNVALAQKIFRVQKISVWPLNLVSSGCILRSTQPCDDDNYFIQYQKPCSVIK
uniref:Uncharacterized protein n=1 Tax=Cacopsylla melanoneura TaxID=428564 RepID=A0A8D9E4Q5_9HEMI